jgi:hypothetical protein
MVKAEDFAAFILYLIRKNKEIKENINDYIFFVDNH